MSTALYDREAIRRLEEYAISTLGIAGIDLMERAGRASFELLCREWPAARRIAIMCGAGNNGGDGYVIARLALAAGFHVDVIQIGPVSGGDASTSYARMQQAGIGTTSDLAALRGADVCVDALFGIGLNRPVQGAGAAAVSAMNAAGCPVLSIDIPSGLLADTGAVAGVAVAAGATVTFIGIKPGLVTGAARNRTGTLFLRDLDLPNEVFGSLSPTAEWAAWPIYRACLPPRARTAHKGEFGHVLIVGGAPGMSGAARLAAEAAMRVGAGLVSVAAHPDVAAAINVGRPEIMAHAVGNSAGLSRLLQRATVVAIGPGLGQTPWALEMFSAIRAQSCPLVVDADALNLLAADPEVCDHWVLTPHPGEAARLLGQRTDIIAADRYLAARTLHRRYGGTIVLKGAGTIVQSAGLTTVINGGNPGMASGGMGDVLTGVIAGLAAQGLDSPLAARAGTALHAAAADLAARDGERGLLASDLMPHLRRLVN